MKTHFHYFRSSPRQSSSSSLLVALLVACACSFDPVQASSSSGMMRIPAARRQPPSRNSHPFLSATILSLRGGGKSANMADATTTISSTKTKKSKSKKNKRKKVVVQEQQQEEENDDFPEDDMADVAESSSSSSTSSSKQAIDKAMKEKDAAEALGDAIRDRADVLREEDPVLQSIDWSVGSLGQALGASDRIRREGGGVQASQSSVIANYFLKSHGGAHGLQCLCSALATLSGLGAIALNASSKKDTTLGLTYTMVQRTFLFAMLKHVSGMLAAASIAAKAIPKIGLSQARQWMEKLVLDPVSQYVFFNALMLLWLPKKQRVVQGACWWWSRGGKWLIPLMLCPILIREVISNMLVISDVLVLWSVGGKDETSASSSDGIETILKVSTSIINAAMSLLVTPDVWRSADPAKRQAILSKLVSRVSLVLEVAIGFLLSSDAVIGLFGAAFLSGAKRPTFLESLTRLICVRLYIHFLWVRRSKIKKLALQMRGGAPKLPFYVLDVLYEPGKALGIAKEKKPKEIDEMSRWERLAIALGLSE